MKKARFHSATPQTACCQTHISTAHITHPCTHHFNTSYRTAHMHVHSLLLAAAAFVYTASTPGLNGAIVRHVEAKKTFGYTDSTYIAEDPFVLGVSPHSSSSSSSSSSSLNGADKSAIDTFVDNLRRLTPLLNANRYTKYNSNLGASKVGSYKVPHDTNAQSREGTVTGGDDDQQFVFSSGSTAVNVLSDEQTLESCGSDQDIFLPTRFSVNPEPPQRGEDVTVNVQGIVTERIEPGATIRLRVKLGLITVAVLHYDFCEKAQEFDHECPIEKGELNVSHTATIPGAVPPGRYTVDINIDTKDQRPITCVRAKVRF